MGRPRRAPVLGKVPGAPWDNLYATFFQALGTHDDMFWAIALAMKDTVKEHKIPLAVT